MLDGPSAPPSSRRRGVRASSEVTTRLLSGIEPADVFPALTMHALDLSGADLAVVALPDGAGPRLIIEYADGDGADAVRGLVLPISGSLSGLVLETGQLETVADFAADQRASPVARAATSHIGPAVLFPLGMPGNVRGVFTIGRWRGASPFAQAAVEVAASFAAQAGVALELADRRRDAEQLRVFEDRDRIARDLHDQVIQRLYAAGMSLQGIAPMAPDPAVRQRIQHVVDEMDQAIADIRTTVFSPHSRSPLTAPSLRGQIVAIADEMTPMLGFPPAIRLGTGLDDNLTTEQGEHLLTVLREAISNVARHTSASQVEVSVEANSALILRVADNGTGIGPNVHRRGLAHISERAELLGGTLHTGPADAKAGTGTVLFWGVPLG